MNRSCPPLVPFVAATVIAVGMVLPQPLRAQSAPQEAIDLGMPRGSCGQSLGLTRLLPLPVNMSGTPAPVRLNMVRFEPMYLEFSLTAPAQVTLQTETVSEDGDPFLTLYASTGQAIEWDDDGAGFPDSLLTLDLAAGSYCAQVRMLDSPTQAPAVVVLSLSLGGASSVSPAAPVSPGPRPDDFAAFPAGTPCSSGAELLGYLDPGFGRLGQAINVARGGRADWVLGLDVPMSLRIDATSSEFDTVLALYDASGRMIAENDDFPGMGSDSSVAEVLDSGLYCVTVRGFASGGGNAVLAVQEEGGATPAPGPSVLPGDFEGGSPRPSTQLDPSQPCGDPALTNGLGRLASGFGSLRMSAVVPSSSRADWTLSLSGPMELQIDAASAAFDTVLSVLDGHGAIVAENDDFPGQGTDSRVIQRLDAGNYCVSVRGFGGGGGAMTLALMEAGGLPSLPTTPMPGPGAGFEGDPSQPCGNPMATEDLGGLWPGFGSISSFAEVPRDGRADWSIWIDEPMDLRIEAQGDSGLDTVLSIFDDFGDVVAENDDSPISMTTDSLIEQRLDAGNYCVSVRGFAGGEGFATLVVAEAGAAMPTPSAPGRPAGATLTPDGPVEELGTLVASLEANQLGGGDTWWLAFDMPETGNVAIDALNLGGGFTLYVADAAGAELFSADGWGGMEVLQIEEWLEAGRHLILLEAESPFDTGMRRVVITRR